ncbi:MAG: hypothetical protein JJU11_14005 [Candidatus Sumerlaeia bacterium]|nr:hypothetical protein [Candidatus Sumerlaeia bacterium]
MNQRILTLFPHTLLMMACLLLLGLPGSTKAQEIPGDFDEFPFELLEQVDLVAGEVTRVSTLPFGLPGRNITLDDDTTFILNSETRVFDVNGAELGMHAIKAGDYVAAGVTEALGALFAVAVVKLDGTTSEQSGEAKGVINDVQFADLGSTELATRFPGLVGVLLLDSATLLLFEETTVERDGEALTLEDLVPGMKIEAITRVRTPLPGLPEAVSIQIIDTRPPDPTPQPVVEVTGRIQSLQLYSNTFSGHGGMLENPSIGLIRVEGTFFDLRIDTRITNKAGDEIPVTDLSVGDLVHLVGQDVGMLTVVPLAYSIKKLDDGATTPGVSLSGRVLSIDDENRRFTLDPDNFPRPNPGVSLPELEGPPTIHVTEETRFHSPTYNGELGFDDLAVGGRVSVVGVAMAIPGNYMAEKVVLHDHNGAPSIVVTGGIESIRGDNSSAVDTRSRVVITVQGTEFLVNESTLILRGDTEVPPSVLEVGMRVRVHGDATAGGTYAATKISILGGLPPMPKPVVLQGPIESIDNDSRTLVVRGTRVLVDDHTEIRSQFQELTFADLEEGSRVRVSGLARDSNTVIARAILVHEQPPHDDKPVVWTGRITSIDHEGFWFLLGDRSMVIEATNSTSIVTSGGDVLGFDELAEGHLVRVFGTASRVAAQENATGHFVVKAERIIVHSRGAVEVSHTGQIMEVTALGWLVGERNVILNEDTLFFDREREPLDADDFSVGDIVKIIGEKAPGRFMEVSVAILLHANDDDPSIPLPQVCLSTMSIAGSVENLDAGAMTFTVDGRTVTVTDTTHIYRQGVGVIDMEDLHNGDLVYIHGHRSAVELSSLEGGVTACVIRVKGEWIAPPREHQVSGRVEAVDADSMTLHVRDLRILAADAEIVDRNGASLAFDAIEPGMQVFARGVLGSNSVLEARLVKILGENFSPGPITPHLIGRLDVSPGPEPDALSIDGSTVSIGNNTQFLGILRGIIDPDELEAGDAVRVVQAPGREDAAVVFHMGETLQRIDTEAHSIQTSLGTWGITGDTVLVDLASGEEMEMQLSDLLVGDLLHVRAPLTATDEDPRTATLVQRIKTLERPGQVGRFAPVTQSSDGNGRPSLGIENPMDTFAFISLPHESESALPNTLYELEMELSSNTTDPHRAPTTRLRMNRSDFSRAAVLEIPSAGSRAHVPTESGARHRLYFVPEAYPRDSQIGRDFFPSLDVLSFSPDVLPGTTVRLEDFSVRPIGMDRVRALGTLHRSSFLGGTDGWEFGGATELNLASHGIESGGLTLAPRTDESFGYWNRLLDVQVRPGALYRGRFLVRSDSDSRDQMPTMRVRLNTEHFEFGSTVSTDRFGGEWSDAPGPTPRLYDVYLYIPEDFTGNDRILAAIDLVAFDTDIDPGTSFTLEEFHLEEVTIDP